MITTRPITASAADPEDSDPTFFVASSEAPSTTTPHRVTIRLKDGAIKHYETDAKPSSESHLVVNYKAKEVDEKGILKEPAASISIDFPRSHIAVITPRDRRGRKTEKRYKTIGKPISEGAFNLVFKAVEIDAKDNPKLDEKGNPKEPAIVRLFRPRPGVIDKKADDAQVNKKIQTMVHCIPGTHSTKVTTVVKGTTHKFKGVVMPEFKSFELSSTAPLPPELAGLTWGERFELLELIHKKFRNLHTFYAHFDVKLENIRIHYTINEQGKKIFTVHIIDVDDARIVRGASELRDIPDIEIGTFLHHPPEWSASRKGGAATDMFALSAVSLKLLGVDDPYATHWMPEKKGSGIDITLKTEQAEAELALEDAKRAVEEKQKQIDQINKAFEAGQLPSLTAKRKLLSCARARQILEAELAACQQKHDQLQKQTEFKITPKAATQREKEINEARWARYDHLRRQKPVDPVRLKAAADAIPRTRENCRRYNNQFASFSHSGILNNAPGMPEHKDGDDELSAGDIRYLTSVFLSRQHHPDPARRPTAGDAMLFWEAIRKANDLTLTPQQAQEAKPEEWKIVYRTRAIVIALDFLDVARPGNYGGNSTVREHNTDYHPQRLNRCRDLIREFKSPTGLSLKRFKQIIAPTGVGGAIRNFFFWLLTPFRKTVQPTPIPIRTRIEEKPTRRASDGDRLVKSPSKAPSAFTTDDLISSRAPLSSVRSPSSTRLIAGHHMVADPNAASLAPSLPPQDRVAVVSQSTPLVDSPPASVVADAKERQDDDARPRGFSV